MRDPEAGHPWLAAAPDVISRRFDTHAREAPNRREPAGSIPTRDYLRDVDQFPSWWSLPREVRVDGARYSVRRGTAGRVEVLVGGSWHGQDTFPIYDDASLQMAAENLVHRHGPRKPSALWSLDFAQRAR
ncbi:MAG: hypothetical protein ABW352_17790 [Polyangiales bacterium]